jgi:signal transduction histidine kinase
MNELAQPLAAALNNARIYTMANRQLEMSALLNRAGVAIALGEADLRSVLTKTLEEVREYIGSHNIRLYRLDEDEQILYPEAVVFAPGRYTPVEWEMFAHMTLRLGEGMTGWAAATGTAVISGDAEHDPRGKHLPGTDYIDESMICVPLKVRESILGVLTMAKIGLFEFGEPELMLASSLAAQIAIALENTRLLQSQLEAREQLERDIERIRHLEAVREEFLYSVSHELKTPLAVITAALEMVDQTPPEERVECLKAYYDLLMRSSERLQRLVGNLLETSKATSGSIELYRQREEPRALVTEAIRRMQPEASSKKLQFQLEIAGSEATSYLDRNRTLQVIENLLSNAIKYSPVGATIIVSASSEPDGEVRISITDEGIGISLEDQQHIFDRFFRSGSGQAISATGTGLGLFLSKALVEAHGGEMGLDSELGRGTRVWFTIPTSNPIRH